VGIKVGITVEIPTELPRIAAAAATAERLLEERGMVDAYPLYLYLSFYEVLN
jgi:hypothetical protein